MELFDKPQTFAKLWSKLARSYAIDALEDADGGIQPGGKRVGREEVMAWLHSATEATAESFKSPRLGEDALCLRMTLTPDLPLGGIRRGHPQGGSAGRDRFH